MLAVVAAALFEAADKPDPLSLTAHYLRPASSGPGRVEIEVVRSGRRHTHLHGRLIQVTERVTAARHAPARRGAMMSA